jgi:hypothetical protein
MERVSSTTEAVRSLEKTLFGIEIYYRRGKVVAAGADEPNREQFNTLRSFVDIARRSQ